MDLSSLVASVEELSRKGVDFSGQGLSLDTPTDAALIIEEINKCKCLEFLNLRGNTLGVEAAKAIGEAISKHPELKHALWPDMFTGRMKTEIPKALNALGKSMILAQTKLTVLDLCDNAFGPIGVEGLAELLKSSVCYELQELRLNNNGLGVTGAKLLTEALTPAPPNLRVLIMGRNRLENPGAIALAKVIKTISKLENLTIPQNGIYHFGVKALVAALQNNPGLKVLNMNDNTVGPRGAKAIGELLPNLPELADLNLGDCLLKTKGAFQILDALETSCNELKALDISSNEIGSSVSDPLIVALSSRPELNCKIGDNPLGSELKQTLKVMGPRVDLSTDGDEEDDDDDYEEEEEDEDESDTETDEEGGEEEEEEEDDDEDYDYNHERVETNGNIEVKNPFSPDVSIVELSTSLPESNFLKNPSLANLQILGNDPGAALITYLNDNVKDPLLHISTGTTFVFCLLGLERKEDAIKVLKHLCSKAELEPALKWSLSNMMLTNLKLIKDERKQNVVFNVTKAISIFASVIREPWIPNNLSETIRFFITNKSDKPQQPGDVPITLYNQLL